MKKFLYLSNILSVMCISFVFYSCEKDIHIDVPTAEEKVVVQGSIDLNDFAKVSLTRNLPYFGTIDSSMIMNLLIQNATVIVSDGIINDTLHEVIDFTTFPPKYYKGTIIKGEVGKTYNLTVIALGKTFTAITTIPAPVPLDTAWFKVESNQDSLGYVWASFTDPAEPGNYYRVFTKRISKDPQFVPMLGSVNDDKYFNGQNFQFSMIRGSSSLNSTTEDPEFGFFKIGDTIVVKACTIDKAHYTFWRTAEGEIYGGNNPFSNPTQIVTNIEGGALGVWGGYGCFYYTVIAK
jgi:hypothetical protein